MKSGLFLFLFVLLISIKSAASTPIVEPADDLPILYINTENNDSILDKETKIPAFMWIEIPVGCSTKEYALGSEAEPIQLEIKGRGNSTWDAVKKPYKLKLNKKTSIMGMPKHKHFALNSYYGNYRVWAAQVLGQELSRILELGWTPTTMPVQLVLNGTFDGLYFLTESIKIDKNRLNIYEQPEMNEDLETVPYGWLVEIDNYNDDYQIKVEEKPGLTLRITHKSPESVSDVQRNWLINSFTEICKVLRSETEAENWTKHIDVTTLVKYFIVREVMNDHDGFRGSAYMYRDMEEDAKWKFGPIWDSTVSISTAKTNWTWRALPNGWRWHLLPSIFETDSFQNALWAEWDDFYPKKLNMLEDRMVEFAVKCTKAHRKDMERWDRMYDYVASEVAAKSLFNLIKSFAQWINQQRPMTFVDTLITDCNDSPIEFYNLQGQRIKGRPSDSGFYIVRQGNSVSKRLIR